MEVHCGFIVGSLRVHYLGVNLWFNVVSILCGFVVNSLEVHLEHVVGSFGCSFGGFVLGFIRWFVWGFVWGFIWGFKIHNTVANI